MDHEGYSLESTFRSNVRLCCVRGPLYAVQIALRQDVSKVERNEFQERVTRRCVRRRGKHSPHFTRDKLDKEDTDSRMHSVQMDHAFMRNHHRRRCQGHVHHDGRHQVCINGGDNVSRAPRSLPNASFSRLESFWMNGELVVRMDKETGPIDVSKHVAAERKSHDSHQTHAQENQSTKRVRRKITPTHRTHGPHIERFYGKQSEAKLSADECTTTWMIRHAACLQHESPLEPTETLSAHVNISRITRVNFYWCGLQRMQECHPTRMLWSHSSRFMSQVLHQKLFNLPS